MMNDSAMQYTNDDGTKLNPDLISVPSLWLTCRKYGNPAYDIPCDLTRIDQHEAIVICFAYEPNSPHIDGAAVLNAMQDCLDRKDGTRPPDRSDQQ